MATSDLDTLANRLRYRVTLEARPAPEDQNALGEAIEQHAGEVETWADVRGVGVREFSYASTLAAEANTIVEIRWRPDMEGPQQGRCKRLRYRDRVLNINGAVDPEGRRVRLLLYCTEER